MNQKVAWFSTFILISMTFMLGISCNRELALLTPVPPANTSTFTPTSTNTYTPTLSPTPGGGGGATPTPGGAVAFDTFDSGGAEGVYSDPQGAPLPAWLAAPWTPGGSTTTQAVTCQTVVSHNGTHSVMDIINFDPSSDLAELGLYSWDAWGGPINASAAANNYSFWVQANGPVTIANLFMCQSSCLPEIGNPGLNLAVPGDGLWHNFVVPIGSPVPPSPWIFQNGVAPWNNNPIVEVFFDMVGPPGAVTVYFDDIYFYP